MLKKTIEYVDFNGITRVEDFYFHMNAQEVMRLEAEVGDLSEYVIQVAENNNLTEMLGFLEKLILDSHGIKSEDGRSFIKTPDSRLHFEYSQAYAELFREILEEKGAAQAFAAGIVGGAGETEDDGRQERIDELRQLRDQRRKK